jgi:hypothetical protein
LPSLTFSFSFSSGRVFGAVRYKKEANITAKKKFFFQYTCTQFDIICTCFSYLHGKIGDFVLGWKLKDSTGTVWHLYDQESSQPLELLSKLTKFTQRSEAFELVDMAGDHRSPGSGHVMVLPAVQQFGDRLLLANILQNLEEVPVPVTVYYRVVN